MKADVGAPVVKSGLGELLRLPPFGRKLGGVAEYVVIPALALLASLVLFGIFVAAVREEPARSLFLYVSGRVRHLVLLAEHADPRRAAHSHRAVHGAAGAARHGDHRRRGRAVDRRALRHERRAWRCRPRRRLLSISPWRSPAWPAAAYGSCCPARCANIRGVNETISSLLLVYIALAILNFLVEGPMRDPTSLNKPSTP